MLRLRVYTVSVAVGLVLALAALGSSPTRADVLDSVSLNMTCTNFTVVAKGHGLAHPGPAVNYSWGALLGGLGSGFAGLGTSDTIQVKSNDDGAFSVSVTEPEPMPPFTIAFGPMGTATLVTGSMTWNTVKITFSGPAGGCLGRNLCPIKASEWAERPFNVHGMILGNPGLVGPPFIYTNAQVRAILRRPTGNDESLRLAKQLIAAKLNIFRGSPRYIPDNMGPPSGMLLFLQVLGHGDTLLENGPLPQNVDPASVLGQQMVAVSAILKSYNFRQLLLTPCQP